MKTAADIQEMINIENTYFAETGKFYLTPAEQKKFHAKITLLNNLIRYINVVNPTQEYLLNEIVKLKAKQNLWIEQGNTPDQVIKQQIKNFEFILN